MVGFRGGRGRRRGRLGSRFRGWGLEDILGLCILQVSINPVYQLSGAFLGVKNTTMAGLY